jgi:16S rRNA G527 N7-methylase RsmG
LTDIDIQNVRAETLHRTFDVVTFRAVERFADTLPVAAKLLAPSGRLAVLISRAQIVQAWVASPQLVWEEVPIPVPESEIRVLLVAKRI